MSLEKSGVSFPAWLGFLALIVIGALMFVHGVLNPLGADLTHSNRAGFIVFGLCAVAVGAFSWIAGATSKIVGREGTVGARVDVSRMPWWAWVTDVAIVILAIGLFFAIR